MTDQYLGLNLKLKLHFWNTVTKLIARLVTHLNLQHSYPLPSSALLLGMIKQFANTIVSSDRILNVTSQGTAHDILPTNVAEVSVAGRGDALRQHTC
jgi:hypothetical protein